MKTLAIVQPEKIGDVIICLPIGKHFSEMGYKVIWPVDSNYVEALNKVVDYVTFVPIYRDKDDDNIYNQALDEAKKCDSLIDLCFGIKGTDIQTLKWKSIDMCFDEYKYKLAGVDFSKKWELDIKRDLEDEKKVYNAIVKNEKYIVCNVSTDRGHNCLNFVSNFKDFQVIDVDKAFDGETGIFSWIYVLENASKLVLTNSSFLNLVNQLNINENRRLYIKNCPRNYVLKERPILKGNWEII